MSQNYIQEDGVPIYISEFINKIANREGFTDYMITHSAGSTNGDGFLGDLLRFKITGRQGDTESTLSLICKMPPPNLLRKKEFNTDLTFRREILMYEYVLPYLIEFQTENGVSEADGFYSFPKCYGTILDDRPNGDHAIVLEDLSVSNFYLWDKLKSIDYDRAKMVLIELGKLHAVSFAIRDKNPEKLSEIRTKTFNSFHKALYSAPTAIQFLDTNLKKAVSTLEPHEKNLIEKVEAVNGSNCFDVIDQVFSNTTPEPFGVIVHGDMWNNNIMYHSGDTDNASKLVFVDWQLSQFGSPTLDVAHYIFCSLDENIRSKHYHEFVDCYFNSLTTTLRKFGCDGQKLFTMADLNAQFQTYGRTCLFAGPILAQIITLDPKNVPDLDGVAQQWQEFTDSGDVENYVDMFANVSEAYQPRIRCLLRDCEREGLI